MKHIKLIFDFDNPSEEAVKKIQSLTSNLEEKYFDKLKKSFPDLEIPQEISVVLTADIWEYINKFHNKFSQYNEDIRPKGLEHIFKTIPINGKRIHVVRAQGVSESLILLLLDFLISDLFNTHFQARLGLNTTILIEQGILNVSKSLMNLWVLHFKSQSETYKIMGDIDRLSLNSMNGLTFAFKRNIRNLHYVYQKKRNDSEFIHNIIYELEIYIRRILTYNPTATLSGIDEFQIEISEVISLIKTCSKDISKISQNDYISLRKYLDSLLKKCFIRLSDIPSKGIKFDILGTPKDLFQDLPDTKPHIIGFLDLLGFKSIIDRYESDNNSMALFDLHTAFDQSKLIAEEIYLASLEDIKKEVKIKMFSDNILISKPYIEFGIDLKTGIHAVLSITCLFQQTFMTKGYYLRGHVTLGQHYSDENMIFSTGLVEAYTQEQKTKYPIISVNPKVIEKIKQNSEFDKYAMPFENMFIQYTNPNQPVLTFLNPFYTFELYDQVDKIINEAIRENTDPNTSEKVDYVSFRDLFDREYQKMGISNIQEEINKTKEKIQELLEQNLEDQHQIYNCFDHSHVDRIQASNVISKYLFLFDLFKWLDNSEDHRFSFLEFKDGRVFLV